MNEDLIIIKNRTFQWKMDFKPDPKKQAVEVCLSRRIVINNPKPLFPNMKIRTPSFVRPHLDYVDITYDKPDNASFNNYFKKIQYNTALTTTDVIRGISLERIYNELGLEPLAERRWYRRMTIFNKIVKNLSPKYLQSYLLIQALNQYLTANSFTFKNSIIISQLKEYKLNLSIKKFLH